MHLFLTSDIPGKIMSALSWTFIHSLWQGLFLSMITAFVLLLTKKWNAASRYNLLLLLFAAFLFTCILTFIREWNTAPVANEAFVFTSRSASQLFSGSLYYLQQITKKGTAFILANEQLIFACWFVFFLFKILKMVLAVLYNQRIRNKQVYEPVAQWKKRCMQLCKQSGIDKTVRILESGYCKIPVVTGHLKPLILMPLGLLAGLPAEQAEAILLHELAHIRRNDYLVNFLQNIAEAIFFFNPAVHWLSSLLREERENCCDDIALVQTKNKLGLAEALIRFKEYELYGAAFDTAFPGRKNILLRRVNRILGQKNKVSGTGEKLFLMTGIIVLLATAMLVTAMAVVKEPIRLLKPASKNMAMHIQEDIRLLSAGKNKVVKNKPVIIKQSNIVINPVMKNETGEKVMVAETLPQALSERQLAELDMIRAKQDQEAALRDQVRAKKDLEQALRDQRQAKLDQEQAVKDKIQAEKDCQQAKIDQQLALKYKGAAERKEIQY
jgi:beta-lactamase regulating signal transducer with metallopeptidase domain